ncbi:MAG: 1-deoxy-D-xylulose-5-phosphate reductoisomerase [Treponema sp.]|nr:1-deoxy-D-xylulose-5-phosphate reductoisomerase [Treponema sp.]
MKRIAVLGATGSIGKSSLDVISRDKENFEVVLISAHSSREELERLSRQFPSAVCVFSGDTGGKEKLLTAIKNANACLIINGISGSPGLEPSLAAIESGAALALANKETIVMAGRLVLRRAKEKNVNVIPVDSEHSAIFHLLQREIFNHSASQGITREDFYNRASQGFMEEDIKSYLNNHVSEIILTASGGPFRKFSLKEMESVTAKDALTHPTWKMGPKITIDSASMANKGLEIIEACVLFNMPPEKIKVVIHPQSIVHSMVRLCNGALYTQASIPDMRHPIHDALYWPETKPSSLESLSFDSLTLEFEKPDTEKFPMLNLARKAAQYGALFPCAYNAANEEAVAAFLNGRIRFTDIPKVTEYALEADWSLKYDDLETVLKADNEARERALSFIHKLV